MLRTYPVDRVACPILQPYFNAMLFGQAIRATSYPALPLGPSICTDMFFSKRLVRYWFKNKIEVSSPTFRMLIYKCPILCRIKS